MIISNNKKNEEPIAFFDSGVGGLTVLKKIKNILPHENLIYFGDTLHVPYGEKTKEQLLEYSSEILNFFASLNCKAVVMACNTTSSVIYDDIKDKYAFKLYPIVQSVAKILSTFYISRLGVFATKATINSNVYANEIHKYNSGIEVFGQHCPSWVNIVENNTINQKESIEIIKSDVLRMMENRPEKIVLGCTHYPFLLDTLSKFEDKNLFIDPAEYFADFIKKDLEQSNLLNTSGKNSYEKFYVSSDPKRFFETAKTFYDMENLPTLLSF